MHVRHFEADTLDEAIKAIKKELGPDAIILKTVTNKGIRGAFKKKIKVTAGITNTDYLKKAKVDKVLNSEQKEEFYNSNAGHIKSQIDSYGQKKTTSKKVSPSASYGQMGLNKAVKTAKDGVDDPSSVAETGLDHFLNSQDDFIGESKKNSGPSTQQTTQITPRVEPALEEGDLERIIEFIKSSRRENEILRDDLRLQKNKVENLEQKIKDLSQQISEMPAAGREDRSVPLGVLCQTLRTLDLEEKIISDITKKAVAQLGEELNDDDCLFDFALKKILEIINVDKINFADIKNMDERVAVLISKGATGQSTVAKKLANKVGGASIIEVVRKNDEDGSDSFSAKMLGLNVIRVKSATEAVSKAKSLLRENKRLIIDLKTDVMNDQDIVTLMNSLKRNFSSVETLLCISAIHSEVYNRKVIRNYKDMIDGLIVNHLDQCVNFGALVNLQNALLKPYVYFGTGVTVPDDIEVASAERIIGTMFNLG